MGNHVLLQRAREQMRPGSTCINRHILATVRLTVPVHHRGEFKVPGTRVHLRGILAAHTLLNVRVVRRAIGVVQRE